MATLTSAAFLSTYNSTFATTGAIAITGSSMRDFTTDIKDSFLNKTDGGTITGNVGIGGAPTYPLDVFAAAGTARITSTGTGPTSLVLSRTAGTLSEWSVYTPAGSTDIKFYSGADRFSFSTGGVGTATDWIATSDRRLKNNIRRINDDVLDKIKKIGAIVSTYERVGTGKKETGFIAQELLEIAPEYVNVPNDPTEMMGVNYAKMTALLFKGIEQLMSK